MKVLVTTAVVAAVLVTAFLVMGAANPRHSKDSRDDSITLLKARISSLERRVESLEKRLRINTARRSSPDVRRPVPRPEQGLPKGWRRKDFNGVPYYLIPLEQKHSRPAKRP
jgi:hypothetical protein